MGIKFEWLQKILGDAYTEEIDKQVAEEIGKYFVARADYNSVNEAKKKLDADLAARDKQLEDLKKAAGNSEELQKQIQALQDENKKAQEKYEADLKDLALTSAIKMAVAGKVHDETLVAGLIDKTKLVIDGDKVVGLDDQLKSLQEQKAFLFKSEEGEPKPGFRVGSEGKGTGKASEDQLASIFGNSPPK